MNKGKEYKKPDMEIVILDYADVISSSELVNGGSGTGDSGGLPSETDMTSF